MMRAANRVTLLRVRSDEHVKLQPITQRPQSCRYESGLLYVNLILDFQRKNAHSGKLTSFSELKQYGWGAETAFLHPLI